MHCDGGVSEGLARVHPRRDQDRRPLVLHARPLAHSLSAPGSERKEAMAAADADADASALDVGNKAIG